MTEVALHSFPKLPDAQRRLTTFAMTTVTDPNSSIFKPISRLIWSYAYAWGEDEDDLTMEALKERFCLVQGAEKLIFKSLTQAFLVRSEERRVGKECRL